MKQRLLFGAEVEAVFETELTLRGRRGGGSLKNDTNRGAW